MTFATIFDTETTGIVEPQLIQAASLPIALDGSPIGNFTSQYFMPDKAIELGALAIHHITPEQLDGYPSHKDFKFKEWVGGDYVIGHNVDYDWEVVGHPLVRRICTLALARHFWPQLDSHKQGALCYYRYGQAAKDLLSNAHDAGADVLVLSKLWTDLYYPRLADAISGELTWERVWGYCEEARIPKVMSFGKHKGQEIGKVPLSYIKWYLGTPDQDPYLVEAFARAFPSTRRY